MALLNRRTAYLWVGILLASFVVILPCLWLPLVSPVDLQSHLYNAWLSTLISQNAISGIVSRPQTTNIVVDLLLAKTLSLWGVSVAERLTSSLLILTFFWGAFRLISVIHRRPIWWTAPWLAILAYGYTFQMGFLNYYLSCGIALWTLSLLWTGVTIKRLYIAVPLAVLACLAHPLPFMWVVGIVAYRWLSVRLNENRSWLFFLGCSALLALAELSVLLAVKSTWAPRSLVYWTGADQALLFGPVYIAVALAFVSIPLLVITQSGEKMRNVLSLAPAQIFWLTAIAVLFAPFSVGGSDHHAPAFYIPDRLSLLVGVMLLAAVAGCKPRSWTLPVGLAVAAVFFAALHRDISLQCQDEGRMLALVSTLPAQSRVVFYDPRSAVSSGVLQKKGLLQHTAGIFTMRLNNLHLLSRACVGHCFDYMNYEPSTEQFRLHALPGNSVVSTPLRVEEALTSGAYVVKSSDLPLYAIIKCGSASDTIRLRSIKEGETGRSVIPLACASQPATGF